MGPRIFIRGYGVRWECMRVELRFNGAADFHPRIREYGGLYFRYPGASMGPRIFIRGYRRGAGRNNQKETASMGPRIFIRGYW